MSGQPLNILCLDGGGARGLSSLLILRDVMEKLNRNSGSPTKLEPCDVFDIICGTSTGGLSAIMLGRLRMRLDDAINNYVAFTKEVFGEYVGRGAVRSFLLRLERGTGSKGSRDNNASLYDASKLESWVKGLVARYAGNQDAHLQDPNDGTNHCCHTFVVAVSEAAWDEPPILFRTCTTETKPASRCMIWQAIRATTAASPFFPPVTFGSPARETYIDGMFSGSNNPSQHARQEARDVFPGREIGCLLSLGTGVPNLVSANKRHEKVGEACVKLVQSCESVHYAVAADFNSQRKERVYFRLSVTRGVGQLEFDEWNRYEEVAAITNAYLRQPDQEQKVTKCVRKLKRRTPEFMSVREGMTTLQWNIC